MEDYNLDSAFAEGGEFELSCAVDLYGQPILRYCHNILCDYTEAQDAVQITFIKAYRKRKSFKSGTSLSAWLYRIAYTTCIDLLRKKKLLFFIPQTQKSSDNGLIDEDLEEALLMLSPVDRGLVFSRVIDNMSYAELEDIYHISSAALRKRYERAKTKLASILKDKYPYYSRLEEKI